MNAEPKFKVGDRVRLKHEEAMRRVCDGAGVVIRVDKAYEAGTYLCTVRVDRNGNEIEWYEFRLEPIIRMGLAR